MSTPSAPDVDQPDGGAHAGEDDADASGRTPPNPDNDQPDNDQPDNDQPDGGDDTAGG